MRFSDKAVVVSGGAHGIGRATAQRFLSEGARVALLDVDVDAAETTRAELGHPDRTIVAGCDLLDTASVDRAVETVVAQFGRVDVLASVAGGDWESDDPLDDTYWDGVLGLNLQGPVRLIHRCLPQLTKARGAIVMVSSINGLVAFGSMAYSSAKAGLSLLAKNLAVKLGPDGVRINVVAPGTVRTRVWDGRSPDRLSEYYPLRRIGEPADIAAAIAFLASSDADWITGITMPVDGGASSGPLAILGPKGLFS